MDHTEEEKRRAIRAVQNDTSLTSAERNARMQEIMRGVRVTAPKEPESPFPPKHEVSYQKGDAKTLGCVHYRRNCKILSPCCSQWMVCRLCHNDAIDDHEIDRFKITTMLCMLCQTEQPIAQTCSNCNEKMANYFCSICNLLDSTPSKDIFHCDKCGICRVGKQSEYVHCDQCGICLNMDAASSHRCIADSLKANCPICFEFLFTSVLSVSFMPCGHPIHSQCLKSLLEDTTSSRALMLAKCPLCQKAVSERQLEIYNQVLEEVIPKNPMPEQYQKSVHILCNQCNAKSTAPFHFYGMKCKICGNYNTSLINGQDDVIQKPVANPDQLGPDPDAQMADLLQEDEEAEEETQDEPPSPGSVD